MDVARPLIHVDFVLGHQRMQRVIDFVYSMVLFIEVKSNSGNVFGNLRSSSQNELAAELQAGRQGLSEKERDVLVLPVPKPSSGAEIDAHESTLYLSKPLCKFCQLGNRRQVRHRSCPVCRISRLWRERIDGCQRLIFPHFWLVS